MFFKRDKLMFKADALLPDSELLKLRFRSRVFLLALVGAFVLLGVPVMGDRLPALAAHRQARLLAEWMLETRMTSQQSRKSYALILDDKQSQPWARLEFGSVTLCNQEPVTGPIERRQSTGFSWRILIQDQTPIDVHTLCFHPLLGLIADNVVVGDKSVTVIVGPSADKESGRLDRLRHFTLSEQGNRIALNPKL
jgi:hypothetical protein